MTAEILPAQRADNTFWWVRTGPTEEPEVAQWLHGVWFMCGSDQPWPREEDVIVIAKIEAPA